ncbi:MAG: AAA family ATPase [Bdellovibrionota bacterium]
MAFSVVLLSESALANPSCTWLLLKERQSLFTGSSKTIENARLVAPHAVAYLESAKGQLYEREYAVDAIFANMIAGTHVILLGTAGIGKSRLVDVMSSNLVDDTGKSSFYSRVLNSDTTLHDIFGPSDYNALTKENKYKRLLDEGALYKKIVFFDEFFRAREGVFDYLLELLAERHYRDGSTIYKGDLIIGIAATNGTVSEIFQQLAARSGQSKKNEDSFWAIFDRFSSFIFIPGKLEWADSAVGIVLGTQRPEMKKLKFSQLEELQKLANVVHIPESVGQFVTLVNQKVNRKLVGYEVEAEKLASGAARIGKHHIPYKRTRKYSPRTLELSGKALRAHVVLEWVKSGGTRSLEATIGDVVALEKVLGIVGPEDAFVENLVAQGIELEIADRHHLEALKVERQAIRLEILALQREIDRIVASHKVEDFSRFLRDKTKSFKEREVYAENLKTTVNKLVLEGFEPLLANALSVSVVARSLAQERLLDELRGFYAEWLPKNEADAKMNDFLSSILARRERVLEARREEDQRRLAEEQKQAASKLLREAEKQRLEQLKLSVAKAYPQFKAQAASGGSKSFDLATTSSDTIAPLASLHGDQIYFLENNQKTKRILKVDVRAGDLVELSGDKSFSPELENDLFLVDPTPALISPDGHHIIGIRAHKAFAFDSLEPGKGILQDMALAPTNQILTSLGETGNHLHVLDLRRTRLTSVDWRRGQETFVPLEASNVSIAALLSQVSPQRDAHNNRFLFRSMGMRDQAVEASVFLVDEKSDKAFFTTKGLRDLYSIHMKRGSVEHLKTFIDPTDKSGGFVPLLATPGPELLFGYRHIEDRHSLQVLEVHLSDPERSVIHEFKEFPGTDSYMGAAYLKDFHFLVLGTKSGLAVLDLLNHKMVSENFLRDGEAAWPTLLPDNRIGFMAFDGKNKAASYKIHSLSLKIPE